MSTKLPAERPSSEELPVVRPSGTALASPADLPVGFAPPPADEEPKVDPRRVLSAILRYKWTVLLCTVLGAVVGMVIAKLRAPTYQAQATIFVELGGGVRGPIQEGQLLQNTNWVDLLRSYTVLDSVVKEQKLFVELENPADSQVMRGFDVLPRFYPGEYVLKVTGRKFDLTLKGGGSKDTGQVGDSIGTGLGFLWAPAASALRPGSKVGFSVTPPRQAALELNNALDAQIPLKDGNFIRLLLTGPSPGGTAATLNSIAEQFVRVAADLKRAKLRELTQILEAQLQSSKDELTRSESALESFRVNTITEPSENQQPPVAAGLAMTQTPVLQNFFLMKTEADVARRDRVAIEAVLAQPPDSGITAGALEGIQSVQNNVELKSALADLTNKEANLRTLRVRYTDDNPLVARPLSEMRSLQRVSIPALLQRLLDELRTRQNTLDGRIAAASRDLQQIPTRSIEEARLTREVAIASQLYTNLQQRYSEARLADASSVPDIRILDPAVVPDRPKQNLTIAIVLGSLAGGFALAIGIALALDRFDRRLRYPEQVTREMGLAILGAVPRVKGNGSGLTGDDAQQVVEALRSIRLNLLNAYGSAGPLITTVTSPGSGDGKSFLSSNLALAFADAGHKTLLIDGDIRRGTLHRVLQVNRKPGLLDYLSGQATREQVIQASHVPSVDFIGCGTRKMGGPELLASPAMSQLLIAIRSQYSVIIIDSAPLGAGVDALVLGSLAGSMVLVLRAGVTDKELALAKLTDLDRLPIRILGAVLNDVKPQGIYKYYGYLPGYSSDDELAAEPGDVGEHTLPASTG